MPYNADAMAFSLGHGLLREKKTSDRYEELRIWAMFKSEGYVRLQKSGASIRGTLVVSRGQRGPTNDCIETYKYTRLQLDACVLEEGSEDSKWTQLYQNLISRDRNIARSQPNLSTSDGYAIYVEHLTNFGYALDVFDADVDPLVRNTYKAEGGNVLGWITSYFRIRAGEDAGSSAAPED